MLILSFELSLAIPVSKTCIVESGSHLEILDLRRKSMGKFFGLNRLGFRIGFSNQLSYEGEGLDKIS